MKHFSVLVAVASLLAGCGSLPPAPHDESRQVAEPRRGAGPGALPAAHDESRQVADLIAYALRTSVFNAEDQRRELRDANKTYAADPGDYSRVRLALLLSLPGTSITDEARAAALLDPAAEKANGGKPGALRQFGRLLHAQVSGRLRETRKAAQLKEQIEALREIDRTLSERTQGRPR